MDKYNIKKRGNQEVFEMIEKHLTEKGSKRFEACGNWIEFFADVEVNKLKVYKADFCNNRFCPICMWRKAHLDAMKISVLLDYLEREKNRAFVFATFTAPNADADGLVPLLKKFDTGFKNLMQTDDIERMNDGYVRKLEITYNGDEEITPEYYARAQGYLDRKGLGVGDPNPNVDTYHPHLHCIFSVTRGYFSGGRYIKRDRWLELWRHVMGDDSITQVDVRRLVRGDTAKASGEFDDKGTGRKGRRKLYRDGFREIAKYAATHDDFTYSQNVFDVFYKALFKRRILTFGGSFAEANRLYKKKMLEHYKTEDVTEYVWLIAYNWYQRYEETLRREMSPGEYATLKKSALDESPM